MANFDVDFTVVLRGYDREQVDAFMKKSRSQQLTPDQIRRTAFTLVWRGYDRGQVDQVLERLATVAAQPAGEAAGHPADSPAQSDAARGHAGPGLTIFDGPHTLPDFTVVLRGYDRQAVDMFCAHVNTRLSQGSESAGLTPTDIREAAFPVVWRGYDRAQVDLLLEAMADLVERHDREGI